MTRDSEPIVVSRARIERAAELVYGEDVNGFLPVWKAKDNWRDGRRDPIQHVEFVIRALNAIDQTND